MPDHWSAPFCGTIATATDACLTLGDGACLEDAYRRDLPLATLDQALLIAAQAAGVPMLGV
ncbi:MAG TPA: hypothetical protein VFG62_25205 [Rhodopila sp.]|nr:hypothetical protein [Rhodopila sp.]